MSDSKQKQENVYECLNSKQQEIAPKIEVLLIGLTISEAKELLHKIIRSIEYTKIS